MDVFSFFRGFSVFAMLFFGLHLYGCSQEPKDFAYYEANAEEARDKVAKCEALLKESTLNKDMETMNQLMVDPECMAASKALGKIAETARVERQMNEEHKDYPIDSLLRE